MLEEGTDQLLGFGFADAEDDLHALFAQNIESASAVAVVFVVTPDHDPRNLLFQDPLRAGRSPSMCATGLQGHIERSTLWRHAAGIQGLHFGMGLACAGVKALADDLSALDDECADRGIRACATECFARKRQSPSHKGCVGGRHAF